MAYLSITTENITTISGLFVYVSQAVPAFIPIMLLSLFAIVFFASYYSQQRIRGYANVWASMSVAGYLVAVISVIMSLIPNLINPFVVMICVIIAIIGTAMLLTQYE